MRKNSLCLKLDSHSLTYNVHEGPSFNIEQGRLVKKMRYSFYIEAYVHEATNTTKGILETCLNLCSQKCLQSSLDVVTNLTPLRL